MASPQVDTPQGTTIVDVDHDFSAEVESLSLGGEEREDIDTTHLATTSAKTFDPADLVDAGTVTLTVHFNPDTTPPTRNAKGTWRIDWPSGTDWEFEGYVNSYSPDPGGTDDKMTADVQIKISGLPTITQSS